MDNAYYAYDLGEDSKIPSRPTGLLSGLKWDVQHNNLISRTLRRHNWNKLASVVKHFGYGKRKGKKTMMYE